MQEERYTIYTFDNGFLLVCSNKAIVCVIATAANKRWAGCAQ